MTERGPHVTVTFGLRDGNRAAPIPCGASCVDQWTSVEPGACYSMFETKEGHHEESLMATAEVFQLTLPSSLGLLTPLTRK